MHTQKGFAPLVWVVIAAVVLGGGYLSYRFLSGTSQLCWPYCPGMTDQDRTDIKKSASDAQTVDWKTYRNEKYGFLFQYPSDWKQTSIFSVLGGYVNAVAFTSSSKEAELQKALKPDSDVGAVVVQGTAIFIKPIADEYLFAHLEQNRPLLNTSERVIDGQTVLHLFHSERTDPNKFGGGSTEVYVFKDRGFVIEANYPSAEPVGELKNKFDQILSTLKFTSPIGATLTEKDAIAAARQALGYVAARDYAGLEGVVSADGLSLSKGPNLDLTKSDVAKSYISAIPKDTHVYLWGYTDGKGDPINLTVAEFINKYIYTGAVDYPKAPDVGVNKIFHSGNCFNSIQTDVAGRTYVGFHFSGFKPEYEGMDWTTLYAVLDSAKGEYKLRAIAKDNWCI